MSLEIKNDELPEGWSLSKFANLIGNDGLFADGDWVESKDQDPKGSIRLLQLADVGDGSFLDKSSRFINEAKFVKLRCSEVHENDVLIARMPDPLGRACIAPALSQRCITVVDVAIVRPGTKSISPAWLMHCINSPQIRQGMAMESTGSTRKRIARGKIAEIEVPVPPFAEQKRIADKLEAVLGRVDACRARLDSVPALLKRFRQSILAAATSGKLTEEWRMTNGVNDEWENQFENCTAPDDSVELPATWKWVAVGNLSTKVTDGVHKKPNYVDQGIPFLTVKSLTAGKGISFDVNNFISEKDHEEFIKRTPPEKGDLLVTKDGTLGVVRMIDTDRVFSIFVSLALVKPKDRRMSQYLLYAFQSPVVQKQMVGVGSGLLHIHLRDLRVDLIPLPPLPEQQEIVRRVENLFAFADRIEARLATAQKTVERLTPATLAKAFRGELVPQDPADEPAGVLLERLAASSESAPKPKRRMTRK